MAYNNTVNKSTGYSPFRSMFGNEAVLPLDGVCSISPSGEQVPPALVRLNAEKNREEAQKDYKERLDSKQNTGNFEIDQKVLMKRTFGSNPKISVKWKEDLQGVPYVVTKRVGPVNYVIKNSTGVEKVYHRNMLKAAGMRNEAQFSASLNPSCTSLGADNNPPSTSIIIQRTNGSIPSG